MSKLAAKRVFTFNIDGLDPDILRRELRSGNLPNLRKIVGPDFADATDFNATSVAPSVTFCAQAGIVTSKTPAENHLPGNEFLRRGPEDGEKGRFFQFDAQRGLNFSDAYAVHSRQLADQTLNPESATIFEKLSAANLDSLVAHNIYGRGAKSQIRPNTQQLISYFAGKANLKTAGRLDEAMIDKLTSLIARKNCDAFFTIAYLLGLDRISHAMGPQIQGEYLRTKIDRQVGRIVDLLKAQDKFENTLFVFVSDHSQVPVGGAKGQELQNVRDWKPIFRALDLDLGSVKSKEGRLSAMIGMNGGLAHVYLQRKGSDDFRIAPRYVEDALPVAQVLSDMNLYGKRIPALKDSLDIILVRNTRSDWGAPYEVYVGDGRTEAVDAYLANHPELDYLDAKNRLNALSCRESGDIILLANARKGCCFGNHAKLGSHGGLYRQESRSTMVFARPGACLQERDFLQYELPRLVEERCAREGNRQASIIDVGYLIEKIFLSTEAQKSIPIARPLIFAGSAAA